MAVHATRGDRLGEGVIGRGSQLLRRGARTLAVRLEAFLISTARAVTSTSASRPAKLPHPDLVPGAEVVVRRTRRPGRRERSAIHEARLIDVDRDALQADVHRPEEPADIGVQRAAERPARGPTPRPISTCEGDDDVARRPLGLGRGRASPAAAASTCQPRVTPPRRCPGPASLACSTRMLGTSMRSARAEERAAEHRERVGARSSRCARIHPFPWIERDTDRITRRRQAERIDLVSDDPPWNSEPRSRFVASRARGGRRACRGGPTPTGAAPANVSVSPSAAATAEVCAATHASARAAPAWCRGAPRLVRGRASRQGR